MTQLRALPAIFLISQLALGCATARTSKPTASAPTPSTGAARTSAAAPGGAAPGGAAPAPAKKSISSVTGSSRKVDGLFSLYQDTANGSLHMLVKKDQLGKEFIYFMHRSEEHTSELQSQSNLV